MGLIEKSMLERWEMAKLESRLDKAKSIKQQKVCCTSNITDDKAQTIDAEPVKHGRWSEQAIRPTSRGVDEIGYYCLECGYFESYTAKYCAGCGAKMDGGETK